MATKHNKRRNSGIMYELLLRQISTALVESNPEQSKIAFNLIKKYFKPGTSLYKEFRLFNSLLKTTASSKDVAKQIISEARQASCKIDFPALEREKTKLIHEINHKISDSDFLHRRLNEYKIYATLQTLMNDWRNPNGDNISRIAEYENQIIDWLVSPKNITSLEEMKSPEIDPLVVKLMTEKFNEKFSKSLTGLQKKIIQDFVQTTQGDTKAAQSLHETLTKIKSDALNGLASLRSEKSDISSEKITEVSSIISQLNSSDHSEDSLIQFMSVAQLVDEVEDKS